MIRTITPDINNKYYLESPYGYNACIKGNEKNKNNPRPSKHSVLPNCVGYAHGRLLEYNKTKCAKIPTCNAGDWFAEGKRLGMVCSDAPSVGAVAVFKGTTYGHVAFVEKILDNGDLFLSESNWNGVIFRNVTVKKSSGYAYSGLLKLSGFVSLENKTEKDLYKPGNFKVTAKLLHVRSGAGLNYRCKTSRELTSSAKKKNGALGNKSCDGYLCGLTFTASEITEKDGYHWGRTPSGWVALEYCERL